MWYRHEASASTVHLNSVWCCTYGSVSVFTNTVNWTCMWYRHEVSSILSAEQCSMQYLWSCFSVYKHRELDVYVVQTGGEFQHVQPNIVRCCSSRPVSVFTNTMNWTYMCGTDRRWVQYCQLNSVRCCTYGPVSVFTNTMNWTCMWYRQEVSARTVQPNSVRCCTSRPVSVFTNTMN